MTEYNNYILKNGLIISNPLDDNSMSNQLTSGVYEKHVQDMIALCSKAFYNKWKFLDLGANIGLHSLQTSLNYDNVEILAIEGSQNNIETFRHNIEQNKHLLKSPISIQQSFIFDGSEVEFSFADSNHACSYLTTTNFIQKNETKTLVKTKKLSDIINFIPDLIKIDIEGSEYEAVLSSIDIFRQTKFVIIELNKYCNENFFNRNIDGLINLMYKTYQNGYVPTNHGLQKAGIDSVKEYFKNNLMLDMLFTL